MQTNQQIISLIKARDESGLKILYKYYSDSLYGIAYRVLNNEAFAEDSFQQSVLKIWNNIDQYDETKSILFTWMANIVRNTSIDIRRLKSFEKEEKTETINPLVHVNRSSTTSNANIDVSTLLTNLDEKYAIILDYLYLRGFTQSELSKELDIPLGTIKTRAKAAIDILRGELKNEKNLFFGMFLLTLIGLIINNCLK